MRVGVVFFFYGCGDHRDLNRVGRRQRQMCIRDRNGRPSGNYASTHSIDGGIDGDLRGNQVNISILMGDADVLLGFHFLHARCFCPIELG